MDFISETIKIYVSRKWIENVKHNLINSEFNENNIQYYKSEIILEYFTINCQAVARSLSNAKSKAFILLFEQLKIKSLLTEDIVLNNIGVEKEANYERNVRSISVKLFNEGPSFISLKSKFSDLYKVTIGKVFFEIKEDVSESFRIIFHLIENTVKDMFNNKVKTIVPKSSVIAVHMVPEKCTLKEVNNKRKSDNIESNIGTTKKMNTDEENCDSVVYVDQNSEYMKFFANKGLSQPVRMYLGELIEKSIQIHEKKKVSAVTSPAQDDDEWKETLNVFVSKFLNELLVTLEITSDDYHELLKKIVDKIIISGEKKLNMTRIREFMMTYAESYKNKNKTK